jgi:hypothetical protein
LVIEHKKSLPQRDTICSERRKRDGGDKQDSGDDGQGALQDHMNSFSRLQTSYKTAI